MPLKCKIKLALFCTAYLLIFLSDDMGAPLMAAVIVYWMVPSVIHRNCDVEPATGGRSPDSRCLCRRPGAGH